MKEFQEELQTLVAKVCWQIVAGRGNGSMVAFDIGAKIPCRQKSQAGALPSPGPNAILARGEYCIFVEHCAWRCERGSEVICTSKTVERVIDETLKAIEGREIRSITVLNDFGDCRIEFDDAYAIVLFCDQTCADSGHNYSVKFPDKWISIGSGGKIVREQTRA